MGKIHFIACTHFGHENRALKRGFENADAMNEHIVECWNKKITKRDTVWLLGDITMEKSNYSVLNRLNGIKKVVLGNHDKPQHVGELLKYVNSVCGLFKYKNVLLSHAPIHPCEIDRFKYNVHGHVHENSLEDSRYINVCCEVVNYTPVCIDDILNLSSREINKIKL